MKNKRLKNILECKRKKEEAVYRGMLELLEEEGEGGQVEGCGGKNILYVSVVLGLIPIMTVIF